MTTRFNPRQNAPTTQRVDVRAKFYIIMNRYGAGGVLTGAEVFEPYIAPIGYYWDFVTYNTESVTYNGVPVVALRRA